MKLQASFKNPRTGEVKTVKVKFSVPMFVFASAFGIPLFIRKLNSLGLMMLIATVVVIGLVLVAPPLFPIANIASLAVSFWLGVKANELTAKNYLERGWQIVDPSSEATQLALKRWKLSPTDQTASAQLPA